MGRHHKNTDSNTRDVNAATRVQTAIKLRTQGFTWEEVAAKAGYTNRGACHNAVMKELHKTITGNIEEMRREEAAILAHLHQRCMQSVDDPSNKGYLFAVDRVLAIRERYAKLMGLDMAKDANMIGAQVIVREVPSGFLSPVIQEAQP